MTTRCGPASRNRHRQPEPRRGPRERRLAAWRPSACSRAAPASALVSTERVASGLTRPVYATAPAGDYGRLFIVEQTGKIKILDLTTGQIDPTPFLQISDLALGQEQGLLGLAFHPDYATNGYFYVNRVDATGTTRIERYQVSANANVANPTPTPVLAIAQPQANHNGGWLGFGPDGYLYASTGDGGGGDDNGRGSHAGHRQRAGSHRQPARQDPAPRRRPLRRTGRNYGIPASNPFVGVAGDDEIWAYGLRNPWRPSFDRETGDLWIADVGQLVKEEVNFQPADSPGGENYGWRLREGTIATPTPLPPGTPVGGDKPAGAIDPIHEYDHTSQVPFRAITGGYVYRGPVAELQGKYFFADFSSASKIWSLTFDGSDPTEFDGTNFSDLQDWTQLLAPDVSAIGDISSFAEDAAGNLYILDLGGVFVPTPGGGEIFRVVPEPASAMLVGVALAALAGARRRVVRRRGCLRYCVIHPGCCMRRLLLFTLTLLLAVPAQALILDSGDGQGNTSPPVDDPGWSHVGRIGGPGGIYLGNGWVLTANHVIVADPEFQSVIYPVVPGSVVQLQNPDSLARGPQGLSHRPEPEPAVCCGSARARRPRTRT